MRSTDDLHCFDPTQQRLELAQSAWRRLSWFRPNRPAENLYRSTQTSSSPTPHHFDLIMPADKPHCFNARPITCVVSTRSGPPTTNTISIQTYV
ncbi:hypothetical protein Hanom_Chr06g00493841 [Helianthus anomalus]